ncbi:HNH endonuclease family protein [Micromonospora sp. NBC_01405]
MRTRSGRRVAGAAVLAAALALVSAGCSAVDEPEAPPSGGGGNVSEQLGQLTVASAGSMKGYSRDHFPHWRNTGKNCDVRDSVLKRDGEDIRLSGCNVVGGHWESVYDGRVFTDPSDVDIDHTVPLANAWRSGANEWDDAKRGDFANDLTRPQLFAVSASSNRAKGDQDPSQWKPANRSYWCKYAENWVTVKHHWRLTVTSAEKAALTDMLGGCTWASKP